MKRKYSDREKAMFLLALEANGGNLSATHRETGVPISTLLGWRDEISGINPDIAELRNEKKEPLADVFERVARIYLDHAETDTVVAKTPGQASVIAAATATDKAQLLRGKPTSITESRARAESLREEAERIAREHNAPVDEVYARLQSRPELKAWLEGDQRAG